MGDAKQKHVLSGIQKIIQDAMAGVLQGYDKGIQKQIEDLVTLHQVLLRDITIQQHITASLCDDYAEKLELYTEHVDKQAAEIEAQIKKEKEEESKKALTANELARRYL